MLIPSICLKTCSSNSSKFKLNLEVILFFPLNSSPNKTVIGKESMSMHVPLIHHSIWLFSFNRNDHVVRIYDRHGELKEEVNLPGYVNELSNLF